MTAQEFVSFLDRYIADKTPNFGDGNSVLTLLYEAYNDANNMDNDAIKVGFRDLYKSMNGMSLREMDTIVNPVCALCRDYEQAGFVHGVEVGMLLANGTTYDWTWVVTHYGYAVKEEDKDTRKKTWGMYLMAKESNHMNVQFDNAETEAATETYADGSLFYYGKTGSNYTLLQLSQGDPVPYSDYDAVYHNEIKDTSFNILRYGYNRYSHSAQRQYINSDADVGQWWEAQHVGDVAPSGLLSCAGMLHGFRDSDKAALTAIEVTTLLNTVTDKDIGTSEKTYDKMFLPSTKEMFGTDQTTVEGDSWSEYWKGFVGMAAATDATDSKRIIRAFNAKTSAQTCRLRSAYRGNSYSAWIVSTAGNLSTNIASYAYRSAPACFIC